MSIKKVAFVVKYFPSVSETFIVNQINGLLDIGYDVQLYAYQKADSKVIHKSLEQHDLLNKVQYYVKPPESKIARFILFFKWAIQHFFNIKWSLFFKCLNLFTYGKDAYTLKLFFESQWFLLPYDFNLIHAHFGMNGNRIAYLKAQGIIPKHVKLINTFHGYDLSPDQLENYKSEYSHLLKQAHAFTVNTPYLESLFNIVNINQIPCYILPVGLDTDVFSKQLSEKDKRYFDLVFCGKLIPLKGPDFAIEIVKRLHDNGYTQVRLHIIGKGILSKTLKKQVENYQLQENIIFYGAQTQVELKQHFEQADAFIFPGRHEEDTGRAETQGLVIQEAQAMKLPVIVSDAGGMKYGLINNESGYVIAEEDLDGFVKAVKELILNPELKLKMGQVGRLFVEKKYKNNILIEHLLTIYDTITEKK